VSTAFKRVGYFRELYYGDEPGLPSIREFVRPDAHPDRDRIVAYLRGGIGLAGVGRYVEDVLDPTARPALTPSPKTDGVWLWREDLAHYVARHHVALPDEFVAHMRANGWAVPALSRAEVSRLSRQLFRELGGHDAEPGAAADGGGM
jgi:hypothetical protein